MTVLVICMDLLREAAARKWFIVLGVAITVMLVTVTLALRMEVVDGALAATRLFGDALHSDIQSVDVALRPLFVATSYVVFYGGTCFGILLCSGFGPSLLSEGRIEHLLSLPVRRVELLAGTLLGVMVLSLAGSLYGTAGLTVILGVKTGFWTMELIVAGLLASASFFTIYAAMLTSALFVRSSALGATVGGALLVLGVIAGYRNEIGELFKPGIPQALFYYLTAPLPRFSQLGDIAADIVQARPVDYQMVLRLLLGQAAFGGAWFAVGVWRFEKRDF